MTLAPHIAWQTTNDGMVLLDTIKGRYFELNLTASRMFESLAGGADSNTIVTMICEEFDAPAETVRRDLVELEKQLRAMGAFENTD